MNNKKAVSPLIAVMLLVAVAVAAVGAYFIWYKSFKAGSIEDLPSDPEMPKESETLEDITESINDNLGIIIWVLIGLSFFAGLSMYMLYCIAVRKDC